MGTKEKHANKNSTVRKRRLCWREQSVVGGVVTTEEIHWKQKSTPEGIIAAYARTTHATAEIIRIPNPTAPETEIVIGRVFHRGEDDLYILFISDPKHRDAFVNIGRSVKR